MCGGELHLRKPTPAWVTTYKRRILGAPCPTHRQFHRRGCTPPHHLKQQHTGFLTFRRRPCEFWNFYGVSLGVWVLWATPCSWRGCFNGKVAQLEIGSWNGWIVMSQPMEGTVLSSRTWGGGVSRDETGPRYRWHVIQGVGIWFNENSVQSSAPEKFNQVGRVKDMLKFKEMARPHERNIIGLILYTYTVIIT